MRFWTLPYDRHLTQWLKAVDPSRPSIMVAQEFGGQPHQWQFSRADLLARSWLESLDLAWQPDPRRNPQNPDHYPGATGSDWTNAIADAFDSIRSEIEQLQMLMQDDRDRYMAEIIEQADGSGGYITSFIDTSEARRPWTMELINCGYAIGNIAYFYYKQQFRRVRPSTLCPGLAPPFGPPAHPSFTSGHSFIGHFIALLLLEIPALRQRYGLFAAPYKGSPGNAIDPCLPVTVTISLANPAVVQGNVALNAGDPVFFQTTAGGALPAPIAPGTTYYVIPTGTAGAFQISSSPPNPNTTPTPVSTLGSTQSGVQTLVRNPLAGRREIDSPLLWLAGRIAKNRERLGVHYPSDSSGSRHIAAGIWRALLHDSTPSRIYCSTLNSVLAHATAEWPTKWT
ncbi:hypothetical protein [Bradyrhizobium sp. CCBAU 11434]|nr:hypothetical protein [Bradyrhizobium sp. CCBAU 11434]